VQGAAEDGGGSGECRQGGGEEGAAAEGRQADLFRVLSRVEEGVEEAEAVLRAITLEEGKSKAEQEAKDG
jgi:hypothetical protein